MNRIRRRALVLASVLAVLAGSPLAAKESTVTGKLTTTEDDALYGVAVMRAAPEAAADRLAVLHPGSRVTVFPETSPAGWWYIEMEQEDGTSEAGFVPRNFVNVVPGPFKDVPGDHWAAEALSRLKGTGFLTGYQGGSFDGERAFTRFEMAVILDRYMGRMKKARERIESMIGNIPVKPNLEGEDARNLDDVVAKLERFSQEESQIREFMGKVKQQLAEIRTDVADNTARFEGVEGQIAELRSKDGSQDRRIDELARTSSRIAADLEALKSKGVAGIQASYGGSGTKGRDEVTNTLASNIVRLKELMTRAENLEAKVAALEARDRLASLLLKGGGRRGAIANLAQRIGKLESKSVGM